MPNLREIAQDKIGLEELKKFLLDHLDEKVLDRAYREVSVVGISVAKEAIEEAIIQLESLIKENTSKESINMAR